MYQKSPKLIPALASLDKSETSVEIFVNIAGYQISLAAILTRFSINIATSMFTVKIFTENVTKTLLSKKIMLG